jgi:signal transduction histidine kinase
MADLSPLLGSSTDLTAPKSDFRSSQSKPCATNGVMTVGVDQRWRSANDNPTRRWLHNGSFFAAFGLAYFLIAELGLGLYGSTDFVSVFWPGFGLSAGVLIALGPRARWPVAAGVIVAIIVAHLLIGDPRWIGPSFALSDAAEGLVTAGLIHRYFGARFSLGRLRDLVGLLAAAVPGSIASFTVWIVPAKLFQTSTEPILTTWQHWFMGDMVGFVTFAPFVIGFFAAVRQPPPRRELLEGTAALLALAAMTAVIIYLPQRLWETVVPVTWLFPMVFWLAARCRPVFAAAGACLVSIAVVWTTVFGVGHFGDAGLPIDDRNLQAQAVILVVALGAFVLAALFAERRENEALLVHSNMLLKRERENKLMSLEAMAASITHEIKQPLGAVVLNSDTLLLSLERASPDLDEIREAARDISTDANRAGHTLDGIRALFQKIDHVRQPIDMNAIVAEVLQSLDDELSEHGVRVHSELSPDLPLIQGNRSQLHQVISNLVHNAVEAMHATTKQKRALRLATERAAPAAISVTVQDSGPGVDPKQLNGIFEAFVTTKAHGMGLGLAICRVIAERHGGQLTASSDGKNGALFQLVLPIRSMDGNTARLG